MNSEEPFTSVNWDREETVPSAIKSPETQQSQNLNSPYAPILEAYAAEEKSPSFPLDSSSFRLEIAGNKQQQEQQQELVSTTPDDATTPELGKKNKTHGVSDDEDSKNMGVNSAKIGSPDTKSGGNKPASTLAASKSPVPETAVSAKHSLNVELENPESNADFGDSSHDAPPKYTLVDNTEHTINQSPNQQEYTEPAITVEPQNVENTEEILHQQQMEAAFAKYNLEVHVTNPISDRDGNSKPFISYLVTSKTNHPEVLRLLAAATTTNASADSDSGETMVKVRRRYGDFRFLHDCLVNDFPQLLVPPLPPKLNFKYLTGDTFSTSFVHKRLNSLDRFVTFICQHKLLSQLLVFHFFVSDSAEWASFTKNLKILKGEDGDGLLVGKVVNEDLLTETIMNFFTASKHKRETNKDILEISDKLKKLYENLIKLDRIFSKLNRKNSDLKHDYEQFLNQINKLASLHENTGHAEQLLVALEANTSFASSVDTNQTAAPGNFKIFSESLLYFLENWARLGRYIDESFLVSLKDCAKYIARLSNLIELHHNKRIDLQVLEDYLSKARSDLVSIGGGGGGGGGGNNTAPGTAGYGDSFSRAPPNPALFGQNSGGLMNNTTQLIKDTLSTSATPHIGSMQTEGKKQRLQQKIQNLEAEISAQTLLVTSLTNRIINEEYPNWDRFNKMQMKKAMSDLCDQEIVFYKGLVDNWTDVEAKLVKRLEELK